MREPRPIVDLLSDLIVQASLLFRQELDLARSETSDRIAAIGGALAIILVGVVLSGIAVLLLLDTVILLLTMAGVPEHWSSLLVAAVSLAFGVLILLKGLREVRAARITPKRTIEQLRRDVAVAKER